MRDKARIPIFIKEFETYWAAHPNLRFGQIVANMYNIHGVPGEHKLIGVDPFHIDDIESILILRALGDDDR